MHEYFGVEIVRRRNNGASCIQTQLLIEPERDRETNESGPQCRRNEKISTICFPLPESMRIGVAAVGLIQLCVSYVIAENTQHQDIVKRVWQSFFRAGIVTFPIHCKHVIIRILYWSQRYAAQTCSVTSSSSVYRCSLI